MIIQYASFFFIVHKLEDGRHRGSPHFLKRLFLNLNNHVKYSKSRSCLMNTR